MVKFQRMDLIYTFFLQAERERGGGGYQNGPISAYNQFYLSDV